MSTQKAKFELFARLARLGFTYDESAALRRIEMTLQRWAEAECGNGNDYGSWAIERDEASGKPYMVHHHYTHGRGKNCTTRRPIADREAGALRRLAAIVQVRNFRVSPPVHVPRDPHGAVIQSNPATKGQEIVPYHQTDPRGCALYLLTREQLGTDEISGVYTRGLAVCA